LLIGLKKRFPSLSHILINYNLFIILVQNCLIIKVLLILCLQVSTEMMRNAQGVSETTRWLAGKPSFSVLSYEGYVVNGVKYFTKQ